MIKLNQKIFFLSGFIVLLLGTCETPNQNYVEAPFTKLDTLATNDWWNRKTSKIINMKVPRDQTVAFGIYTTSNNNLKLSAQLFPLYPEETRIVRLELFQKDQWKEVQTQKVNEIGWAAFFRIEGWDMKKSVKYRILHGENAQFEGTIRKDPVDKNQINMAAPVSYTHLTLPTKRIV